MAKEKKQQPKAKNSPVVSNCGPEPTRPGTGAGDWQCKNGKWVWVENIG